MSNENIDVTQGGLSTGIPMKVTGGTTKGALATITPPSGMLMDAKTGSGILENMEKLAAKIESPYRQFQEGLKDMSAWTAYNKAPALAIRDEAAANDRNTLYNIRQQQAAMRVAQQQAQAENNRINALMSGTGGADGAPAGAGGKLPQHVIDSLNAVNPMDVGAKQAILSNYYKTLVNKSVESQYNPSSFVSKPTFIPEIGQELDLTPFEVKTYQETKQLPARFGVNLGGATPSMGGTPSTGGAPAARGNVPISVARNNPGNLVDPKTGEIRTFATPQEGDAALTADLGLKLSGQSQAVKDRFGPQVGNFMSPALLAETWAPSTAKGNSPESTQNYQKAIANALGMSDPTAQIPNTPESLAKAKMAITNFEAGNNYPTPTAAAAPAGTQTTPTAPTAPAAPKATTPSLVLPYPRPINAKQVDANMKAEEDYRKTMLTVGEKEATTSATESGKSYAKMKELAETAAKNTLPTAEGVLAIATDPKRNHIMGYFHGGDKLATALFTASKHLSNKPASELEEEFVTNRFNQQELEDYRTLKNASDKLGISFAADVFKGARMGIGLERMAQNAKGISPELPPEVNRKNAELIRDAGVFEIQKDKMFHEWAQSHGGKLASFHEFESSPEYIKFRDDATKHFIDTYKGIVKVDKSSADNKVTQSEQDRAKAELEKRKGPAR